MIDKICSFSVLIMTSKHEIPPINLDPTTTYQPNLGSRESIDLADKQREFSKNKLYICRVEHKG